MAFPAQGMPAPPSRPLLHRANASTQSLPVVDSTDVNGKRRPSMSTAKLASLNAAASFSTNSSPLNTPVPLGHPRSQYFDLSAASVTDMTRTESADTHRSLKNKSSRKELKELARSTTPTAGHHGKMSAKQAAKQQQQHDDDDDDARSIDSFTCSFSSEFDRQKNAHAVAKGTSDRLARQKWLDATFRRLSQKNGVRRNAPHLKRPSMPTITDVDAAASTSPSATTGQRKSSSASAHFLDFSEIISPVPRPGLDMLQPPLPSSSTNVTPRPQDYHRFPYPAQPSPMPRSMDENDAHRLMEQTTSRASPLPPVLRTRRSEDSLTVRRRTAHRQQGSLGHAPTSDATSPVHAVSTLPGTNPVPRLPDWAQSENRALRPLHVNSGHCAAATAAPARMARAMSHDATQKQATRHPSSSSSSASVDMQRALSHDPNALHLSFGPSLMSNFEDWQANEHAYDSTRALSPTTTVRSQSALSTTHMPPLSPYDAVSPSHVGQSRALPTLHGLNRGSVGSAASDSDISSSVSSVPQTPVSRINMLPVASVHPSSSNRESHHVSSVYYDIDPILEDELTSENAGGLASLGARFIDAEKMSPSKHQHQQQQQTHAPPSAFFMSPHNGARTMHHHHVASIFAHDQRTDNAGVVVAARHAPSPSFSSVHSSASDAAAAAAAQHTIRGASHAVHGRPRAATTSNASRPTFQQLQQHQHQHASAAQQASHHGNNGSSSGIANGQSASMTRKSSSSSFSRSAAAAVAAASLPTHSRTLSGGEKEETKRTSVSSNTSAGTSSSSSGHSSTSSGASALLSYMRGFSKSQTSLTSLPESSSSPSKKVKDSSSSGTLHAPSPTKQRIGKAAGGGGMTAEHLANSIGRKFGRGIATAASRS